MVVLCYKLHYKLQNSSEHIPKRIIKIRVRGEAKKRLTLCVEPNFFPTLLSHTFLTDFNEFGTKKRSEKVFLSVSGTLNLLCFVIIFTMDISNKYSWAFIIFCYTEVIYLFVYNKFEKNHKE